MNYEHFDQITSQQSYIDLSSVAVGMQTHNSLNLIHLTPFISQCFSQNQPITSSIYFLLQGQTAHRQKKAHDYKHMPESKFSQSNINVRSMKKENGHINSQSER